MNKNKTKKKRKIKTESNLSSILFDRLEIMKNKHLKLTKTGIKQIDILLLLFLQIDSSLTNRIYFNVCFCRHSTK